MLLVILLQSNLVVSVLRNVEDMTFAGISQANNADFIALLVSTSHASCASRIWSGGTGLAQRRGHDLCGHQRAIGAAQNTLQCCANATQSRRSQMTVPCFLRSLTSGAGPA